jgi:preprotein translocase YajC subunit
MADPSEQYKASLEAVEKLLAQQKSLNQATEKLKDSWGVIATEVFKLDGAAFFKQVPLGTEDIKRLNSELKKINEDVRSLGEEFGKALDNDDNIKEFSELAKGAFIKMQQEQEYLSKLNHGDEVFTKSGILGKISGITEKIVTLELEGGTKMKVLKTHIGGSAKVLLETK